MRSSSRLVPGLIILAAVAQVDPRAAHAEPLGIFPKILGFAPVKPRVADEGVLIRGRHPKSEKDFDKLEDRFKVRTIIDLMDDSRAVETERAEAERRGIRFISVPLADFQTPSESSIRRLRAVISELKSAQEGRAHSIELPAYVHCRAGRNRTGLFVFMYRVEVLGWTPERALQDMYDSGFIKKKRKFFGQKNALLTWIEENYFRREAQPLASVGEASPAAN